MLAKLTTPRGALLYLFFIAALPSIAQRKVDGKVTGPDSKPVYGATVSVKNTNIATSTSAEGTYSITLPGNSNVLVFSYVGYEESEVSVTGNTVDVVLKAQSSNINEVVV